jgi:tRNA A-37 threonylcarbamoyl transferase component Bud32
MTQVATHARSIPSAESAAGPRRIVRRWLVAGAMAVMFASLFAAALVDRSVLATVRDLNLGHLEARLQLEQSMVETWQARTRVIVGGLAGLQSVRDASAPLLAGPADRGSADEMSQSALEAALQPALDALGADAFLLVDRDGIVRAADVTTRQQGATLHAGEQRLVQLASRSGASQLSTPGEAVEWGAHLYGVSLLAAEEGSPAGHIVTRIPLDRLGRVLALQERGQTGEGYLFNSRGLLLSASRWDAALRARGVLSADEPSSALHLTLEVPSEPRSGTGGGRGTLIQPVRDAVVQGTGANLEGYTSYHGGKVVGAWAWLPELQVGIAVEVSRREAYQPLYALRMASALLLALLGLLTATAWISLLLREMSDLRSDQARHRLQRLGQYTLGRRIGQGAMGEVFEARHALLRRPVALKVLRGPRVSESRIERFEREAQATAELTHPNTVSIYDFGRTDDGALYYVMEYLEGRDLEAMVRHFGAMPPARVLHFLLQITGSLGEAHRTGIIHRDIKPANVFICHRGGRLDFVKVLDFGLAKDIHETDITATGGSALLGTPSYMAPELLHSSENVSPASDVYAVGALGFFLLTGRRVFDVVAASDLYDAHLHKRPERPSVVRGMPIDPVLEGAILRCLEKSPHDRPEDALALHDLLQTSPLAGEWTDADAARWWRDHDETLREVARRWSRRPRPTH